MHPFRISLQQELGLTCRGVTGGHCWRAGTEEMLLAGVRATAFLLGRISSSPSSWL